MLCSIIESFPWILNKKNSFISPEVPKARATKTDINSMIFIVCNKILYMTVLIQWKLISFEDILKTKFMSIETQKKMGWTNG